MSSAGSCQKVMTLRNNIPVIDHYEIIIMDEFLNNPFSDPAILAHELCHVIYSERIQRQPLTAGYVYTSEKATLEEERTVDLLVFMFKIGEFQMRVARDKRTHARVFQSANIREDASHRFKEAELIFKRALTEREARQLSAKSFHYEMSTP